MNFAGDFSCANAEVSIRAAEAITRTNFFIIVNCLQIEGFSTNGHTVGAVCPGINYIVRLRKREELGKPEESENETNDTDDDADLCHILGLNKTGGCCDSIRRS